MGVVRGAPRRGRTRALSSPRLPTGGNARQDDGRGSPYSGLPRALRLRNPRGPL